MSAGVDKWKLSPAQRRNLAKWIGEGCTPREINARAAKTKNPFTITRQGIDYYRAKLQVKVQELREKNSGDAFLVGFALKNNRIAALQRLADRMLADLLEDGKLWLEDKKTLGGGEYAEIYDFERFNAAEVDQFREVLADIAAEMGARNAKQLALEVPSESGPIKVYVGIDPEKV